MVCEIYEKSDPYLQPGEARCPGPSAQDILFLQPVPDKGPRPAPAETVYLDIDEPYTSVPAFEENRLSYVLDQDTDNFKRQWAGILASLKGSETLGNYQQARIRHFHKTLDDYLAA